MSKDKHATHPPVPWDGANRNRKTTILVANRDGDKVKYLNLQYAIQNVLVEYGEKLLKNHNLQAEHFIKEEKKLSKNKKSLGSGSRPWKTFENSKELFEFLDEITNESKLFHRSIITEVCAMYRRLAYENYQPDFNKMIRLMIEKCTHNGAAGLTIEL